MTTREIFRPKLRTNERVPSFAALADTITLVSAGGAGGAVSDAAGVIEGTSGAAAAASRGVAATGAIAGTEGIDGAGAATGSGITLEIGGVDVVPLWTSMI